MSAEAAKKEKNIFTIQAIATKRFCSEKQTLVHIYVCARVHVLQKIIFDYVHCKVRIENKAIFHILFDLDIF